MAVVSAGEGDAPQCQRHVSEGGDARICHTICSVCASAQSDPMSSGSMA